MAKKKHQRKGSSNTNNNGGDDSNVEVVKQETETPVVPPTKQEEIVIEEKQQDQPSIEKEQQVDTTLKEKEKEEEDVQKKDDQVEQIQIKDKELEKKEEVNEEVKQEVKQVEVEEKKPNIVQQPKKKDFFDSDSDQESAPVKKVISKGGKESKKPIEPKIQKEEEEEEVEEEEEEEEIDYEQIEREKRERERLRKEREVKERLASLGSKPPVQQQQQQQTSSGGGWGGWFSSISSAVTSTINSITQDDEGEPEIVYELPKKSISKKQVEKYDDDDEQEVQKEEEIEEEEEKQDKVKVKKEKKQGQEEDEDDVEGLLNVIDKGVFKTADIIADSLFFAGNLLSSGFKSVQENAKMENVKGLAQDVANMSLQTTRMATNSEIYEKGQKMASQVVDSSVETLESYGQKAYNMFSDAKKQYKDQQLQQQQTSPSNTSSPPSSNQSSNASSPSNSSNNILPPKNLNTPTSTPVKQQPPQSSNQKNNNINISEEPIVFQDNQFDSTQCNEFYKITSLIQDIEKVSVECTMKIHQFNRKTPKDVKPKIEKANGDIKQVFENENPSFTEAPKNLTNSNQSFELEKLYNNYFDKLQEYLPTLNNQSQPTAYCRGLEKLYHFTAIGLELLLAIAQSSLDEKPDTECNDLDDVKDWVVSKANIHYYLIFKITQDIKTISSMIVEIIKTKQNPQTKKLINTIHLETTNATSLVTDCKAPFTQISQMMFINQSKSKITVVPGQSPMK